PTNLRSPTRCAAWSKWRRRTRRNRSSGRSRYTKKTALRLPQGVRHHVNFGRGVEVDAGRGLLETSGSVMAHVQLRRSDRDGQEGRAVEQAEWRPQPLRLTHWVV